MPHVTELPFRGRLSGRTIVVDGDTLHFRAEIWPGFCCGEDDVPATLRVCGVDAPETHDPIQRSAALVVAQAVRDWIAEWERKPIYVLAAERLDKYGRILGDLLAINGDRLTFMLTKYRLVHCYQGDTKAAWTVEELTRIVEWGAQQAAAKQSAKSAEGKHCD